MESVAIAAVAAAASSIYYSKRANDAQKKQIKAADKAAKKAYELERQQTELTLSEEQRKNRNLLAQQQSAYKAKLGAGGLSQPGSGQAVLDTMQREHDLEDKYLTSQANISLESLLNGITQTSQRNLLSLKSIKNRQRQDYISGFSELASGVGRSMVK